MGNTTVKATLVMELNVECPDCGHDFDLFRSYKNDEGQLYNKVLGDGRWKIDADERLKTCVICPNCSVEIEVKGVIW